MKTLTLAEIDNLRALAFENACELIEEAEILFTNERYARTYTLAHLASEEMAKLPTLALAATDLTHDISVNWKRLDEQLRSHTSKLRGLLFLDFLGTDVDPNAKEISLPGKDISRVELFNDLKNASLYSGIYLDSFYKPSAVFGRELALEALTGARNRRTTFAKIEEVSRGKTSELANNPRYKELLKSWGVQRYA
jgi:AbiV family abortive infection protein